MKVRIEINVPEGPARNEVLAAAMKQAWGNVNQAMYEHDIEGGRWDHCHAALFNIFDSSTIVGHVDLSTKEIT